MAWNVWNESPIGRRIDKYGMGLDDPSL